MSVSEAALPCCLRACPSLRLQDQARTVKAQLLHLVPGLRVFLDVDDLTELDALERLVDASDAILCFLAGSFAAGGGGRAGDDVQQYSDYFRSAACCREFRQALRKAKPMALVLETNAQKGGVSFATHAAACPAELRDQFEELPVVPWHRLKAFQLVSLCATRSEPAAPPAPPPGY